MLVSGKVECYRGAPSKLFNKLKNDTKHACAIRLSHHCHIRPHTTEYFERADYNSSHEQDTNGCCKPVTLA